MAARSKAVIVAMLLAGCVATPASLGSSVLPTSTPYSGPFYVDLWVEPILVGDLGDRVTGPVTVFIDAPTAQSVEVYLQPVDMPYGGKPLADPVLIGADNDPSDGFAVAWQADEPYLYVELYAVAYLQLDVDYSRTSRRVTILFDWRNALILTP